ncbi:MAG TPA: hypothetical protein VFR04_09140, partial [Solirubrobacterales bacterium]|nr:hypothetical protein [Solirubrobacterales bacterium]
ALRGVSCPSASACIAVGTTAAPGDGHIVPLVESWNGSSWSTQEATDTVAVYGGSNYGRLSGVSCTSASACTTVGYRGLELLSSRRALAEGRL